MRQCADIVFREYKDLPSRWSASSFDRNTEDFQVFLKFDIADKSYPTLPPILYPGLRKDPSKVFRNRIGPEVCNLPGLSTKHLYLLVAQFMRGILFGKDSISTENSQARANLSGTIGISWGIKNTTPGLIAFAFIAVRLLYFNIC